ncbi:PAK4-inhibitor INKA2 [Alosa pseudoharengus]|uniref:PAK4-inhibitor INKA2 n=1 Tax=Alosa pseudoharengus TaxID=34774 RepID=UPI003F8BD998
MESPHGRPERKNMDQCLRRLKQELLSMREAGDGLHAQMNSMMGALQELKLLQVQTALEHLDISAKPPSHTHTHTRTHTHPHTLTQTHTQLTQALFDEPPFPDPPSLLELGSAFISDSSMEEATPPPLPRPLKKRASHRGSVSTSPSSSSSSSSSGSGSADSSLLLSHRSSRDSATSYEDASCSASGLGSGSSSSSGSSSGSGSGSGSGSSSSTSWHSRAPVRQRQPPAVTAPPPPPLSLSELQELLQCLSRQGPPLRHDLCPLGDEEEEEDGGDWTSSLMSCSRTRQPLVLGDSFLADLVGNWLDLPEVGGAEEGAAAGWRDGGHTPRPSRAQELRRRLALTTGIFKKVLRSVRPDRDKLLKQRPGWPDPTELQNPDQLHKRTKKSAAAAKPKGSFYRPFWSRKGKAGASLPTDRLPPLGIGPQRGAWVPAERGHPLFDHNAAIWV